MKKLVLTVTLVALLAAAVFGGQAIASNKPADVTVSEEESQEILFDWGGSYWGSPLRMQTISDRIVIDDTQSPVEVWQTYPETRNVHLTVVLNTNGVTNDGWFDIWVSVGGFYNAYGILGVDVKGFYTYEFDTNDWFLVVNPASTGSTIVLYEATITYPR